MSLHCDRCDSPIDGEGIFGGDGYAIRAVPQNKLRSYVEIVLAKQDWVICKSCRKAFDVFMENPGLTIGTVDVILHYGMGEAADAED